MPAPPLFHPTRVVLVDDEPRILRMTALLLEDCPEVRDILVFQRAQEALAHLDAAADAEEDLGGARVRDVIDEDAGGEVVHRTIDVSLASLPRLLERSREKAVHSVIVSDFAMPGMDGLEFFARLRDRHARRLLLTALCDEKDAVTAFNRGSIHRFLHKGDPAGPQALREAVRGQCREYFRRRYAHLGAVLALGTAGQFLSHPRVAELLDRAMRESGCREFCFSVDPPGFRLDGPGRGGVLALADGLEYERHRRVVREIGGEADLAEALAARSVLPTGCDARPLYEHGSAWRAKAIAARPMAGGEPLFWGWIDRGHVREPAGPHRA